MAGYSTEKVKGDPAASREDALAKCADDRAEREDSKDNDGLMVAWTSTGLTSRQYWPCRNAVGSRRTSSRTPEPHSRVPVNIAVTPSVSVVSSGKG